jgi:hypothetical protein
MVLLYSCSAASCSCALVRDFEVVGSRRARVDFVCDNVALGKRQGALWQRGV